MSEEFDLLGKGWEDVPDQVEADAPLYYKVPAGIYVVAFGRLTPKYQDINKKACEPGTPGSIFTHATVPLWLIESHGTAEKPLNETILGSKLVIPEGKKTMELYYNLFLSWDKKDQWRNIKMFDDFQIKGNPNAKMVINNPNGQGKVVRLKSLSYYYGRLAQISLMWSEKEFVFIDTKNSSIKLLDHSISPEAMVEFESKINAKVERERAERQAHQSSSDSGGGYTPPATDFNEDANDLNSFLNS